MRNRLINRFAGTFTNNFGLKIIAFFFAAFLWLIVVNVDDPVDTQVYRNIEVTMANEDVVTSGGKVYQILNETDTVSVTIQAKRSVLSKIKSSDIVAKADFKNMELVSLVPITVTVSGYDGEYTSATADPHNLQVKVEDIEKNNFVLTVATTGTLRDGYVLGDMTTNPESITIGGADSLVNSIDKAVARINVSGLSESGSVEADLVLYDAEGNVIDQTLLSNNLGDKGLSVNVEVLETKDLPIVASVSGTPADGYSYNGLTVEPQTVKVYGSEEVLKDLNEIILPSEDVDITGLSDKKEFVIDISKYLPEKVKLVDATNNNVMIKVTIDATGSKTIELPVESITVNGLADGLKLDYITTEDLKLKFQGEQDLLDKLDVKSGSYMDLKDFTKAGEYEVPVTVETPTGVTMISQPTVKIRLSDKE